MRSLRGCLLLLIAAFFIAAPTAAEARGGRGAGYFRKRAQAQAKQAAAYQKAVIEQQAAIAQAQAQAEAERKAKLHEAHQAAKAAADHRREVHRTYLKRHHKAGIVAITPVESPETEALRALLARPPVVAPIPGPHFIK